MPQPLAGAFCGCGMSICTAGLKAPTIACGAYHSLAVTEALECIAWGGNYYGQVGNGSNTDQKEPVIVIKENVISVAAGRCHSLAVTTAGEVYAWGNNEDCLLGTGWKSKQDIPVKVIHSGAKAVSAGWKHCLALTEAGEVFAWGGNEYGQLGDGSKMSRRSPVKVISGHIRAIASGWYHNLAITDTGDVWTWGFTSQDASSGEQHTLAPVLVIDGGIKAIACGSTHCLALTEEGNIMAWGGNDFGQLGDGTMTRRISPVTIATNCISIACGSYHSVALDENYNVVQWGFMMEATRYGDGTWNNETTPSKVDIDNGAFAIAAGGVHTIATSHKGEVMAWGGNSCGQIGNNKLLDRELPVTVLPSNTVETVPMSEIIAKMMRGPEELAIEAAKEVKQKKKVEQRRDGLAIRSSDYGVPELLHRIVGDHPRNGAGMGASYPLAFDGSAPPELLAPSCSNTLGFMPGTGFGPNSVGGGNLHRYPAATTQKALSWPAGAGTSNPLRKRPSLVHLGKALALKDTTLHARDRMLANSGTQQMGERRLQIGEHDYASRKSTKDRDIKVPSVIMAITDSLRASTPQP